MRDYSMNLMLLLAHGGDGGWFPHGAPPLHPILVNFTAALLPTSLLSDVLGRLLRRADLDLSQSRQLARGVARAIVAAPQVRTPASTGYGDTLRLRSDAI